MVPPLLTEARRNKIAPLLPKPSRQRKDGGWRTAVLEGILWIFRSGAAGGPLRPECLQG